MKCPKCGLINENDAKYCVKCGAQLNEEVKTEVNTQQTANNTVVKDGESEARTFAILSLVLYFAGTFAVEAISFVLPSSLRTLISGLGGLCPLAGIVIMIIGRVNYPTNKFLKVVMWIIIGSIILGIIGMIILFVVCVITCSTLDTSGCS